MAKSEPRFNTIIQEQDVKRSLDGCLKRHLRNALQHRFPEYEKQDIEDIIDCPDDYPDEQETYDFTLLSVVRNFDKKLQKYITFFKDEFKQELTKDKWPAQWMFDDDEKRAKKGQGKWLDNKKFKRRIELMNFLWQNRLPTSDILELTERLNAPPYINEKGKECGWCFLKELDYSALEKRFQCTSATLRTDISALVNSRLLVKFRKQSKNSQMIYAIGYLSQYKDGLAGKGFLTEKNKGLLTILKDEK